MASEEARGRDCFASYELDTLGLLELSSDNISRDERRMRKTMSDVDDFRFE